MFPSVGNGTAWDLGLGLGIAKMKLTFSVTDIGHINWNKNILTAKDSLLPDTTKFNYAGITSWNVTNQTSNIFGDKGLIKFRPGSPYSTSLPAKFRMGIGFQFTQKFAVGADVSIPLNNNPTNLDVAYFALGTKLELANNLGLNFGFAGNSTYGFSLPVGITLSRVFKILEISLATNNLLTYINPGNNPNISLAMAIFRLNIDPKL